MRSVVSTRGARGLARKRGARSKSFTAQEAFDKKLVGLIASDEQDLFRH